MTKADQDRRWLLKQQRRILDRQAEAIAAANPRQGQHAPSTRAKQAKWHHEVAAALAARRGRYDEMRRRMAAIAAELARTVGE